MTLEEKVDAMYSLLVVFQQQTNTRFQHLEKKLDAILEVYAQTLSSYRQISETLDRIENTTYDHRSSC
jgi:hypothetical protein